MASTFQRRTDELLEKVGTGKLEGSVEINQAYAKYQHERMDLKHTSGKAQYLRDPLFENYRRILQELADNAHRGRLVSAMARGMERVATGARKQAPKEMGDLANSARVRVKDRGRIAYNREPVQRRLSKAALKAKYKRRNRRRG